MLGISVNQLAFGVKRFYSFTWRGDEAFAADMEAILSEQRSGFDVLVRRLSDAGVLDVREAGGLRPRIRVQVDDQRREKTSPLRVPGG